MIRLVEALVFLSLATGLHVGAWSIAPRISGATAEGGQGQAQVTLMAAVPQQAALARAWQNPPATSGQSPDLTSVPAPLPLPPRPAGATAAPRLPHIAALAAVLPAAVPRSEPAPARTVTQRPPVAPGLPQSAAPAEPARRFTDPSPQRSKLTRPAHARPDTPAQADTAAPPPAPSPKPPKPARQAKKTAPAAAASPANTASGGGKSQRKQAGRAGPDSTQSANAAARNKAQATWGAKIQRRVHRQLRYPRGATGSGVARVVLTLDRGGRLTSVRLARSSGVAAFDTAALGAVKRAGRFPSAPKALTDTSYAFTLSLAFRP